MAKLETRCPNCKIIIDFTDGRFADELMKDSSPTFYRCGACDTDLKIISKIDVELITSKEQIEPLEEKT